MDRGPAPRYNERRTFWFRFILAAQLPATVSDGLYSSTSLSSLCDYFACCSLPLRYADFLQNFCSAEICTTSLHQQGRDLFVHSLFNIFSRETTFLTSAFGGLRESHPLSLHPRARFSFTDHGAEHIAFVQRIPALTILQLVLSIFSRIRIFLVVSGVLRPLRKKKMKGS